MTTDTIQRTHSHVETLCTLAGSMNDDELAVLISIAEGLTRGRTVYGALQINHPTRNWDQEASEEARDLAVYLTAYLLRVQRQQLAPSPPNLFRPNHPYATGAD